MFKDYNKYLSTSLKVYLFVLICVFILKLIGIDYFGIEMNNPIIKGIDKFCYKFYLTNVVYSLTLYINVFVIYSITLNENSRKLKLYTIFVTAIYILIKFVESKYINIPIFVLGELIYMFVMIKIYNKNASLKRYLGISLLLIFYQFITLFIRNINYVESNSFILNTILDVDYILLELISYEINKRGGLKLCGTEVLSYLQKLILSVKQLKKYPTKFLKKSKKEKFEATLFLILSLIWNCFTVLIVILIAKLNNTIVECIFILTSFWISKQTFGKAFHFDNALYCFIISNLAYYGLNRITTPLGISIFVPILLGVGLSYITSKFVKSKYKPLYRGMPNDLFEETILKVTDKDSMKYKVCYEFYILKKSDVSLSFKYNYSIAGIRKIKDRINDKIKEL